MKDETKLTPWQRARTRLHLFLTALRKRLTVGVRAMLLDGRKVLLVRHTYTPGWQFPGGGVEPFETAQAAAARESLEETGYRVSGPAVLHGVFLNRIAGGGRDHVALYVWREFRSQCGRSRPMSKSPNAGSFRSRHYPKGTASPGNLGQDPPAAMKLRPETRLPPSGSGAAIRCHASSVHLAT